MKEILEYLADHGEGTDAEIAMATEISLADVRLHLSELASQHLVLACRSIRFEQGREIEEIICRMIGFTRPIKPGKKTRTQINLSWSNSQRASS